MNKLKAAISLADQAASSATNILVLIAVARVTTVQQFGVFSTAYLLYIFILGIHQSYIGQVLVLSPPAHVHTRAKAAVIFGAVSTTVVAVIVAGASLVMDDQSSPTFLALAAAIPFLVLQDVTRFVASAIKRPGIALLSDSAWLLVAIPTLLFATEGINAARAVLTWASGALIGLLVALALLARSHIFRGRADFSTLLDVRGLSPRFLIEFATTQAAQLPIFVIGAMGNVIVAGALRSASTLMGPLNVLFTASQTFGAPALVSRDGATQRRYCTLLAGALCAIALVWASALLLLPSSVGILILGDSWASAREILWILGLQYVLLALLFTAKLWVRLKAPRKTLPIQIYSSVLAIALVSFGYILGGLYGTAASLVLVTAVQVVMLTLVARRVDRPVTGLPAASLHLHMDGGK